MAKPPNKLLYFNSLDALSILILFTGKYIYCSKSTNKGFKFTIFKINSFFKDELKKNIWKGSIKRFDYNKTNEFKKTLLKTKFKLNKTFYENLLSGLHYYGVKDVPKHMLTHEMCIIGIKKDATSFLNISPKFHSNKMFMDVVSGNGLLLKYIPLQNRTLNLCVAAINQHPIAIQFVPPNIVTHGMCVNLLQKTPNVHVYNAVPRNLKTKFMYEIVHESKEHDICYCDTACCCDEQWNCDCEESCHCNNCNGFWRWRRERELG